jgi:hypothetical protein
MTKRRIRGSSFRKRREYDKRSSLCFLLQAGPDSHIKTYDWRAWQKINAAIEKLRLI